MNSHCSSRCLCIFVGFLIQLLHTVCSLYHWTTERLSLPLYLHNIPYELTLFFAERAKRSSSEQSERSEALQNKMGFFACFFYLNISVICSRKINYLFLPLFFFPKNRDNWTFLPGFFSKNTDKWAFLAEMK